MYVFKYGHQAILPLSHPQLNFFLQHISKSHRPTFPEPRRPTSYQTYDSDVERGHRVHTSFSADQTHDLNSIGGPSYENIAMRPNHERNGDEDLARKGNPPDPNAGILDALPLPRPLPITGNGESVSRHKHPRKASVHVARRPPSIPILLPEHRYCSIDEIVKPFRTHHCRNCGTVRINCQFIYSCI